MRTVSKEGGKNFRYEDVKHYCDEVRMNIEKIRNEFAENDHYDEYTYEELTKGREIVDVPIDIKENIAYLFDVPFYDGLYIKTDEFIHKELTPRF